MPSAQHRSPFVFVAVVAGLAFAAPRPFASSGSASVVLRVGDDVRIEIDAAAVPPQWCAALAVALVLELAEAFLRRH